MEQLRKIAKRLVNAKEKVVFAIAVMVLIWRVVQILVMTTGPEPPKPERAPVPPTIVEPGSFNELPNVPVGHYANIAVARWNLTPTGPVIDDEEDSDLPDIQLEDIEEVRGKLYATISVDGRSVKKRKGQSFADRRAVLDEVDAETKTIVFRWLPSNKKYERKG